MHKAAPKAQQCTKHHYCERLSHWLSKHACKQVFYNAELSKTSDVPGTGVKLKKASAACHINA